MFANPKYHYYIDPLKPNVIELKRTRGSKLSAIVQPLIVLGAIGLMTEGYKEFQKFVENLKENTDTTDTPES